MKNQKKDMLVVGFALFSMFFGAGNLIFPPYLGVGAANQWLSSFVCYYMADIGLAIVALFAMLKCNSDVDGITRRIGKVPSILLSSAIVLCVGPLLAVPRTAATTFEMSVVPLVGNISPVISSVLFFVLILILCVKESSVVDIVGKVLTPALFVGLLILIFKGVLTPIGEIAAEAKFDNVYTNGVVSGYQTMDVLATLIFGIIILKTVKAKGHTEPKEMAKVVGGAGIVAAIGLVIVYCGLTYLGATASNLYGLEVNRSTLILEIIKRLLGQVGIVIFAIVVALACVTTAVALVSSAGSYFSRLSGGKLDYKVIVTVICVFSMVVANIGLEAIVSISSPILNIVYPAALTLIILSFFGEKIKNDNIFKLATLGALVISTLDTIAGYNIAIPFIKSLPLASLGFSWIIPAILCGIIGYFIKPQKTVNEIQG